MAKKVINVELKIREVMSQKGITQTKLAELTGINQSVISQFGKKNSINRNHLIKIVNALGITDIKQILDFKVTDELED
mgnify:FL=1|jgi:hypothetical protein